MITVSKTDNSISRIATVGMYDGVHCGHKFLINNLINEAAARGLRSAVITFRNHPLSVVCPDKNPHLLSTYEERMNLLASTGVDDCIVLDFDNEMRCMTANEFLEFLFYKYGIKVLMVGFNNRFGHNRNEGMEQYREIGKKLGMDIIGVSEFSSDDTHISSSFIRKLISEGKIVEANDALGYRYSITGTITEGKKLGRTLGFPTANLLPDCNNKLIPGTGVYAAKIHIDDNTHHNAMVNIGYRPTVDNSLHPFLSIEAHIMDFSENIYGKTVTIEFLGYIRSEQQFDSLQSLKSQLESDRNAVNMFISKYCS